MNSYKHIHESTHRKSTNQSLLQYIENKTAEGRKVDFQCIKFHSYDCKKSAPDCHRNFSNQLNRFSVISILYQDTARNFLTALEKFKKNEIPKTFCFSAHLARTLKKTVQ